MTIHSLWQSGTGASPTSGPSSNNDPSYNAGFISGTVFAVKGGGNWLNGYYWWVVPGGTTAAVKCALWCVTSPGVGTLVPGSVVTSGTLTAGAWNYIPLSTPIQLAPSYDANNSTHGGAYIAAVGWTTVNGFPDTNNYWGTGGAGVGGLTSGPLVAYSGVAADGGTLVAPYSFAQGVFSTAGSDPSVHMPATGSNVDNFWVDVAISDTAPAGYAGSVRLWPNKYDANASTSTDSAIAYTIATEVHLANECELNNVWYYSPSGSTELVTRCDVWNISTGLSVASITSPTWLTPSGGAGSAGAGWLKAAFAANTTLPAGSYRVSVYSSNGGAGVWSATDLTSDYWGETNHGVGYQGITTGPLTAPGYSSASSGYLYASGSPGATPPYSNGTVTHAQPVFGQLPAGTVDFPQLWAAGTGGGITQNYWVDLEVTSLSFSDTAALTVTATVTAKAIDALSRGTTRSITATISAVAKAFRLHHAARSVTATIGAAGAAIRHRSAARQTTVTITGIASHSGATHTAGARPQITATITAAVTRVRHRIAATLITATVTSAGRVFRHRSAARPVTVVIAAAPDDIAPGRTWTRSAARPVAVSIGAFAIDASKTTRNAVSHPVVSAGRMSASTVTQKAAAVPSVSGG